MDRARGAYDNAASRTADASGRQRRRPAGRSFGRAAGGGAHARRAAARRGRRGSLRIGVDGRYLRDDHPGIGRHLFHSLRALAAAAGDDDELVVLHDPRAPRTRCAPEPLAGPRLRLVAAPMAPRSVAEQFELPGLLRRLDLDAFHSPYPFGALRCPCPRVVTVYDLIALDRRHGLRSPLARRLAALALGRVARGAAAVLTLSQAVRALLVERLRLPAERVHVVGAAADPAFRPVPRATLDAARAALGLPPRYVVHLGTAKPHKNVDRLLGIWARRRPDGVALVLAGGSASSARALQDRARRLAAAPVVALGPVDDTRLPALLAAAEALVLPSLDEGFGLPLLEAMACGTPVACADIPVLREVAGQAAAFFDPTDEGAIARALQRLLDSPGERATLAADGLRRAAAWSWEAVAAHTWSAYRAAARPARRTSPRSARAGVAVASR